jgi:hypothetical protein
MFPKKQSPNVAPMALISPFAPLPYDYENNVYY